MNKSADAVKIDKKYIAILFIAIFLSWIFHEFAHWIAGECLGYKMGMTLNNTFPVDQVFSSDRDYQIMSAAGPCFTLLEAYLIFRLMLCKKRVFLYPFLFSCFYMRLFAGLISILNPNDEARISKALGWGKFTLPVIVSSFLFILVLKISKLYKFNLKFNLINTGLTILFSSIIILADKYLNLRIL